MENDKRLKRLYLALQKLNSQLKEESIKTEVVLIGGWAGRFLLNDYRQTLDIDFLLARINDASKERTWRELLFENGMEEVTVVEVPPVEEIESHDVLEFSNLTVRIPTIEYFAVTKIFSERSKDAEDLIQQKILENCDPEKLQKMFSLYKGDLINPNNMNHNFKTLEDVLRDYGINVDS
ncbi:DUF6036 family nucleotidyltransferase [Enterococcus faecalis]|uniref:DUF6036 family nucleotidyltransferase n=1 Tax=Enterococcus faecalis TaxID=1351 RepID=UPI001923F818|nr:hypothetical protein [Enterococcus faecalis]EGO7928981.1 hypothetical protein [Enterococcus faecalis]EHB5062864.1 hypothetical protein [Enterococcus faecalis]EHZ5706995.1 hypothetical protein [Enterococcus faecalis]EKG8969836.1 hypothetical protein [Enterococcus faecalis]